ncbi:hypothetical protein ACFPRL_17215 [Pseudoclavibacter helvolus]
MSCAASGRPGTPGPHPGGGHSAPASPLRSLGARQARCEGPSEGRTQVRIATCDPPSEVLACRLLPAGWT